MTVTVEELRAWVDDEIDQARSAEVAEKVSADPELQKLVAELRASALPYAESYSAVELPPMPDSLHEFLDETELGARQADSAPDFNEMALKNNNAVRLEGSNTVGQPGAEVVQFKPRKSRMALLAVAASVLAAAGLGFFVGSSSPIGNDTQFAQSDIQIEQNSFVQMVAAYQALYVRETVEGASFSAGQRAALSASLEQRSGVELQIPDLEAEGYQFKRAQQLTFNGSPLVQLVYLRPDGLPLALCYLAGDGQDQAPTYDTHFGLNTAEWQQGDNRLLLLADASHAELAAVYELASRQL